MNATSTVALSLLGGVTLAVTAAVFFYAIDKVQVWSFNRKMHRYLTKRWEHRTKGRIMTIGRAVKDPDGREHAEDFRIMLPDRKQPFVIIGPKGEVALAGWTNEELLEIAKRRKEFE